MKCPQCRKEFEEVFTVPVNAMEPFTSVDPLKGIRAYGVYDAPKTILCHVGQYLHFAFMKEAEVQPADVPAGKVWMVVGEERLVKMEKLDQRALAEAKTYHVEHPQTCETEGCTNEGIPCYYEITNDVPDAWHCSEHAHDAGFCPSCGMFNAGFESFDFSESGLCESCDEMFRSELDDFDEYDADYDEWEDYEDE